MSQTDQHALEYAVKAGMLKALLDAGQITDRQFYAAMDVLRTGTEAMA